MKQLAVGVFLLLWSSIFKPFTLPTQAGEYSLTPISITNGAVLNLSDINDLGHLVGAYSNSNGYTKGFVWQNGGIETLGYSFNSPLLSKATSINERGIIAGIASQESNPNQEFVTLWIDGDMHVLSAAAIPDALTAQVNNHLHIASRHSSGSGTSAYEWSNGIYSQLPNAHPTSIDSLGINDLGVIVGNVLNTNAVASYWTNHVVYELQALDGWTFSTASSINMSNQIAGYALISSDYQGFLWGTNGFTLIDSFVPVEINDFGLVVGFTGHPTNQISAPALWRSGDQLQIQDLLPADSGWTISEVSGINNLGQIIGKGVTNGITQGFLLNPPLSISASISNQPTASFTNMSYSLTISNGLSSPLTNAIIRNPIPQGMTFLSASHEGTVTNNVAIWTFPEIPAQTNLLLSLNIVSESLPWNSITNEYYTIEAETWGPFAGPPLVVAVTPCSSPVVWTNNVATDLSPCSANGILIEWNQDPVSWGDEGDASSRFYRIYRSDQLLVPVMPYGATLYVDDSIQGGMSATYQVEYVNSCGYSSLTAGQMVTNRTASLVLSPSSLPQATNSVAYSQALSTSGGTAPYHYQHTSGSLPQGINIATNGLVSGTTTQTGTFNFGVVASDSEGCSISKGFSITVVSPDLTLRKSSNTSRINPGALITYSLNYTNQGSVVASGVEVVDPLPTSVEFVSSISGSYNSSTHKVTVAAGTLAAGANGSAQIQVRNLATSGTLVNTAFLTSSNGDGNFLNNTNSVNVNVNSPPVCLITQPANNSSFESPASISLAANSSDSDGSVTQVQFFSNATSLLTDTSSPFGFTWNVSATGTFDLSAIATDNEGATNRSAAVRIILATNSPPVVTLASPANGAVFSEWTKIVLDASASDPDGSITQVEFFRNSSLIATDTASPYLHTWWQVTPGTYSLQARATDNGGTQSVSSVVNVTVNAAPSIVLTQPASNSIFISPATIVVAADASDPDGSIVTVGFYSGSTTISSDSTSPYSITWSNVTSNFASVHALASDNRGLTSISQFIPLGVRTAKKGDFSRDDHVDLVWRNSRNGANQLWLLVNGTFSQTLNLPTLGTNSWKLVGASDFNQDGHQDILWRDHKAGKNQIWTMNTSTLVSVIPLPDLIGGPLRITATGDLNGDAKPDILWRNQSTGANMVWLMNGTTFSSSVALPTQPTLSWKMVGTGDFNQDGKVDIVWRNSASGANMVWLMNGTAQSGVVTLPSKNASWQIVATGDYNSDGKVDLVFYLPSTGKSEIWLMNGSVLQSKIALPPRPDVIWQMVGPK